MKTNDYLQKYGQKALELLNKKCLKHTTTLEVNPLSDHEQAQQQQNSHHIHGHEKKISLPKPHKSNSNKSLVRNSKSKSKISVGTVGQIEGTYTFQKPLNFGVLNDREREKNRKKLIISGLSTPKNNRSGRIAPLAQHQQKLPSSSTKKKATDMRISEKLNQALLLKHKSTKSLVKQLLQCLDMISQHECKINKWINQFKDIVYHIADQASNYRKKYKDEVLRSKRMQREMEELEVAAKMQAHGNGGGDRKRKPVETVIMEENYKLREKVEKLEKKIENFQKKQLILIDTLERLKDTKSNGHPPQSASSYKKQQSHLSTKIKKQFYGTNLQQDQQDQSDGQQQENQ